MYYDFLYILLHILYSLTAKFSRKKENYFLCISYWVEMLIKSSVKVIFLKWNINKYGVSVCAYHCHIWVKLLCSLYKTNYAIIHKIPTETLLMMCTFSSLSTVHISTIQYKSFLAAKIFFFLFLGILAPVRCNPLSQKYTSFKG